MPFNKAVFLVFPSTQDPVRVSTDCANGQDIRASYELSYTNCSGTSTTTCVVNGTDCSNGTCRHELQNNIADNRCHPPVLQFSNETVIVTVTAENLVGRSNSAVSLISELFMALLFQWAIIMKKWGISRNFFKEEGHKIDWEITITVIPTTAVASFPGRRRNGLATSASSNCIRIWRQGDLIFHSNSLVHVILTIFPAVRMGLSCSWKQLFAVWFYYWSEIEVIRTKIVVH